MQNRMEIEARIEISSCTLQDPTSHHVIPRTCFGIGQKLQGSVVDYRVTVNVLGIKSKI
jgi:hypothetical protein